ncbi:MAG: hypothetical protein J1F67_01265 [Muribaculaceae bacterium]|nr:hypothetical protein [Muribaculaceae bacterium]
MIKEYAGGKIYSLSGQTVMEGENRYQFLYISGNIPDIYSIDSDILLKVNEYFKEDTIILHMNNPQEREKIKKIKADIALTALRKYFDGLLSKEELDSILKTGNLGF